MRGGVAADSGEGVSPCSSCRFGACEDECAVCELCRDEPISRGAGRGEARDSARGGGGCSSDAPVAAAGEAATEPIFRICNARILEAAVVLAIASAPAPPAGFV
eukprot:6173816-Pleurochrysis_carterae.AAC.2